jgi:hypothetical protein
LPTATCAFCLSSVTGNPEQRSERGSRADMRFVPLD